jgi:hypothetical protein
MRPKNEKAARRTPERLSEKHRNSRSGSLATSSTLARDEMTAPEFKQLA